MKPAGPLAVIGCLVACWALLAANYLGSCIEGWTGWVLTLLVSVALFAIQGGAQSIANDVWRRNPHIRAGYLVIAWLPLPLSLFFVWTHGVVPTVVVVFCIAISGLVLWASDVKPAPRTTRQP